MTCEALDLNTTDRVALQEAAWAHYRNSLSIAFTPRIINFAGSDLVSPREESVGVKTSFGEIARAREIEGVYERRFHSGLHADLLYRIQGEQAV